MESSAEERWAVPTEPVAFQVDVQAIGRDGEPLDWTGTAQLRVVPGALPGARELEIVNGVAQEAMGYMEQLRTQREYTLFGILGIYLLGILDANIDAHLHDFDVSDDLSISPQFTQKQLPRYRC